MTLYGYTDSDWAAERVSRRSISGYVTYLNHNFISSCAKFHPVQCLSSMAEYMGEVHLLKELLFIYYLLSEFNPVIVVALAIQIFGDNEAALKFGEDQSANNRTKHIDLRHHYLYDMANNGTISLNYVATARNIADIFTKALGTAPFRTLRDYLLGDNFAMRRALHIALTTANTHRHLDL